MALAVRSDLWHFMDVRQAGALEPVWARMGEGYTDLTENKNPQEYSRKYIHEITECVDITGYATAFSYAADVITNDPTVAKIEFI